jgi:hypothetical protein
MLGAYPSWLGPVFASVPGWRGEAQIAEERSDEGGGLRFGRGARGNRGQAESVGSLGFDRPVESALSLRTWSALWMGCRIQREVGRGGGGAGVPAIAGVGAPAACPSFT